MIFALTKFKLRNTPENQTQRVSEFLEKAVLPAATRASVGTMGFFSSVVAPDSPFILVLASFPSLAGMESAMEKMAADKEYVAATRAFDARPGLGYMRLERSLLRGFEKMPAIEVPPTEGRKQGRIFELRVYESNNGSTLREKIRMFNEGEIDIFRKTGLAPVFFGETIVGTNMPNLTYMVAFDDLASREKNWRAFGGSPEWQKLRATPGWGDAEIVSNISNSLLRPLPFSPIR